MIIWMLIVWTFNGPVYKADFKDPRVCLKVQETVEKRADVAGAHCFKTIKI
jgi:hypothetical protein